MISYELGRREGHDPAAEAHQLLLVEALDSAQEIEVGFDCDGDGLADARTLDDAVRAMAAGVCECRPSESRDARAETRRTPRASSRRRSR